MIMNKKFKYLIEVFWSEDDKGYIALVPDLPGCNAWGANEAEAIEEVKVASQAWLELAKDMGQKIPEPKYPNHKF